MDEASIASLDNLFLCLATFIVKEFCQFCLMTNINLPSFNLKVLPLVLLLQVLLTDLSASFSVTLLYMLKDCNMVSPAFSSSDRATPNSLLFFTGEVFKPSVTSCNPLLCLL